MFSGGFIGQLRPEAQSLQLFLTRPVKRDVPRTIFCSPALQALAKPRWP